MPENLLMFREEVKLFESRELYYLCVSKVVLQEDFTTKNVCFLFTIDKVSGRLYHQGIPNVDLFETMEEAEKTLDKNVLIEIEKGKTSAIALIGMTYYNDNVVIAVVTQEEEAGRVFGRQIKRITNVAYVKFRIAKKYEKTDDKFLQFPVVGRHFYSNELDLGKVYFRKEANRDSEFCWNKRWRLPFALTPAEDACIMMIQGHVKTEANVTGILKRSFSPSMRNPNCEYGLDDEGYAIGECECELVVEKDERTYVNVWRRGSVPLSFDQKRRFSTDGTQAYFDRMLQEYKVEKVHVVTMLPREEACLCTYKEWVKENPEGKMVFQECDSEYAQDSQTVWVKFQQEAKMDMEFAEFNRDQEQVLDQRILFRFDNLDGWKGATVTSQVYATSLLELLERHLGQKHTETK